MDQTAKEADRLRGRLEALLITMGNHALSLAQLIDSPIEHSTQTIEQLEHLADITRNKAPFAEPHLLAEEGVRLCRLYAAQEDAPVTVIREMIDGAAAVMSGLDRIRNILMVNLEANKRLEEMQTQTGGPPRLNVEQQIALSGHDIERQKIVADASHHLLEAAITFAGASMKGLLLLNGGAAVATLAFIGSAAKNLPGTANPSSFAIPLFCFGAGAAAAVSVAMAAYLSQIFFYGNYVHPARISFVFGQIFRALGVILAIGSIYLFLKGLISCFNVFAALT